MVAPHDTGDLVRSLVRVPGSGSDKSAGSVCCDLSRASTLAASVPVNPNLPAALTGSRLSQQPTTSNSLQHIPSEMKKVSGTVEAPSGLLKANVIVSSPVAVPAQTVTNTSSRKRPCSQESTLAGRTSLASAQSSSLGRSQLESPESFQAKRARIVYVTPQQVAESANNVVQISLPSGTISRQVPQQIINNATIMTPAAIAQLLQERNTLRQEKQVLQQQLNLFHQLFRNKEKLTSVVKRLGLKVD